MGKLFYLLVFGLLYLLTVEPIESENVLFLGLPLFSHLNPMIPMAKELYKRGHNSYFPVTPKLSHQLKAIKGVHFLNMSDNIKMSEFIEVSINYFSKDGNHTFQDMQKIIWDICDDLLLDEKWFQYLTTVNATLAVVDNVYMSNCLTIIPYKLSIPYVLFGTTNIPSVHRIPWIFSAFPFFYTNYSEQMSILERLYNTYAYIKDYIAYPIGTPSKNVKAYAPNKPEISFENLLRKAELHIVETDVLIDFALPTLPNVEYLGGMATCPAKSLDGDLLEFVNSSKNGIIVVSFGSVVSTLPKEHLEKMGEAFKKIKYDVVWKWSDTNYSSTNVFLTKWMPQNDLLGHPKTKLFITHCGNGGQFESLYNGVPMLGFPMFGDQQHNGKRMENKEYGIPMDLYDYTVKELLANINEIIDNPKYKKNIQMASDIFKSRPEHPSVRGARIVNDVIKYGGSFLRSYCQDMPLYQYFMLDILTVVLSSAFIGILIVIFILRKCFSFCY